MYMYNVFLFSVIKSITVKLTVLRCFNANLSMSICNDILYIRSMTVLDRGNATPCHGDVTYTTVGNLDKKECNYEYANPNG